MSLSEDRNILLSDDDDGVFNDSNRSLIYCCHGNNAKICCQINNDEIGKTIVSRAVSWSHCHEESGTEETVDTNARRKLIIASILCLMFMIGETVGGLLANSLAIATDAAHLLTDFASFMISLFSLWISSRPASRRMSFGWYRAEVIGALTSVIMIWVVTGILCFMAVERIINKSFEIDTKIMLITAAIGVCVNIIMGIALHGGGVPHGHGHSHSHDQEHGHGHGHSHSNHKDNGNERKVDDYENIDHYEVPKRNINVHAAFIHVLGDFIQSIGVLTSAIIIYFKPEWSIVDPLCTFLFSILVIITTFTIITDVLNVLMEGIPKGIDFLEVQRSLFTIPGVLKVHNLRIWSLSMDKTALSTHLAIGKGENPISVLKKASNLIKSEFGIFELTIQVEEYRDEMKECAKCQTPKS